MTTPTAETTEGNPQDNAPSGKPDPRETWPASIREKFDKAATALREKAAAKGWTPRALERMLDVLTREHAALARAAQERNRRESEERRIAQAGTGAKRKREDREKIILGGIAKKIGADYRRDDDSIDTAVIAGMMLEALANFGRQPAAEQEATVTRWRESGREALGRGKKASAS